MLEGVHREQSVVMRYRLQNGCRLLLQFCKLWLLQDWLNQIAIDRVGVALIAKPAFIKNFDLEGVHVVDHVRMFPETVANVVLALLGLLVGESEWCANFRSDTPIRS